MPLTLSEVEKMRNQWFRTFMPYCLEKIEYEGRKHVYLPVNRYYKPLGLTKDAGWVEYADHAHAGMIFANDPKTFQGVWYGKDPLYLYDDSAESRRDYFERLGKLVARSIKVPGRSEAEF